MFWRKNWLQKMEDILPTDRFCWSIHKRRDGGMELVAGRSGNIYTGKFKTESELLEVAARARRYADSGVEECKRVLAPHITEFQKR